MPRLEDYGRHPAPNDPALNIAFLAVIFGGAVSLILAAFGGAEFWRPVLRSILGMYLAVWIAYGLWLLDIAPLADSFLDPRLESRIIRPL